jgi:hypothetical protein
LVQFGDRKRQTPTGTIQQIQQLAKNGDFMVKSGRKTVEMVGPDFGRRFWL